MEDALTYEEMSRLANDAQTEVSVGHEIISELRAQISRLQQLIKEKDEALEPMIKHAEDLLAICKYDATRAVKSKMVSEDEVDEDIEELEADLRRARVARSRK